MLYRLAYFLFWVVLRLALALLGGIRITGRERVPARGPLILAPNHVSYADPPLIGYAAPRIVWFMAKAHLFQIPVAGPIMRIFHAFPVEIQGVDREALRYSEGLLARGEVVCIFPEGGVPSDGCLQPFKAGLALIALRSGAPVMPVAIVRANRFLPPTSPFPRFARGGVQIHFGRMIQPEAIAKGLDRRQQMQALTQAVRDALLEMLPEEHHPEPAEPTTTAA